MSEKTLIEKLRGYKSTPRHCEELCYEAANVIESMIQKLIAAQEESEFDHSEYRRLREELRHQLHVTSALLREASGKMSHGTWSSKFRDKVEKALIGRCEIATESAVGIDSLRQQLAEVLNDSGTAWAQAHRLAIELECLLLDTKDNAVVSKWWASGMEALSEYQELQSQAAENAEAWTAMRKAGI